MMAPSLTTSQIEQHNAQQNVQYELKKRSMSHSNDVGQEVPFLVKPKEEDAMSTLSNWSSFCLEWLFDPNRIDHLPLDEQVE